MRFLRFTPHRIAVAGIAGILALLLPLLAAGRTPIQASPGQNRPGQTPSSNQTQPILIELFTSEGCSSCPPADALLAQLDSQQFVPGVKAIVLSEHVSYWNGQGWDDPFSSQAYTERQNTYAAQFRISGPYTPQAVVDGSRELVGSDRSGLIRAVESAASQPKILLTLEDAQWSGNTVTARLSAGTFPKAALTVALADDSDRSNVLHGENQGRDLRHVAVVRNLVELRKTAGPLSQLPIKIQLPGGIQPQSKMRLIVFLADPHTGKVLGVTMQPIQH